MSIRIALSESGAARADLDTELALPGDSRTVTTVADYLDHNKVFNVKDYGAKGDGVTDDTQAIIDCATAAGTGGHVYFPPGRYKITGNLITGLPDQQTWEGSGYQLGVGGTTSVSEIRMTGLTGTQVGISAGANHVFRNLLFRGPGKVGNTAVGLSTTNHVQLDWCQFYSFYRAVSMSGAFYTRYLNCEWKAVGVGVYFSDACYNVRFVEPVFRLYDDTDASGGVAIQTASTARNILIHGGSIEDFTGSGGINLAAGGALTIVGTYWESSRSGSNAIGIEGSAASNQTITIVGCQVYLTELNRWVNLSGKDQCVLVSHGNHFVCANTSSSNPIAYVLPSNATGGYVDLRGDSWTDVSLSGASYVGGSVNGGAVAHATIIAPTDFNNLANDYEYHGRPLVLHRDTAAPTTPATGAVAYADRTNWNPCGVSGTDAYLAGYDGARWNPIMRPTFIGSKTFDPASIAANTFSAAVTTVAVPGAVAGDEVKILFSLDTQGTYFRGRVTAGGIVTVDHDNRTASAVDLASGTLTAVVVRW